MEAGRLTVEANIGAVHSKTDEALLVWADSGKRCRVNKVSLAVAV